MSNYINDHLTEEQILDQLMEECAELIQAAHKVIRSWQAVNRPHGGCDYIASLEEEIADVILCTALLSSVDGNKIGRWIAYKADRWEKRLREEAKGC